MLTIGRVREFAKAMEAEDLDVSWCTLAARLSVSKRELHTFVTQIAGLRNEIGIVADHSFPGLVMAHAADCVRMAGKELTRKALAWQRGTTLQGIAMYLARHPGITDKIGLESYPTRNRKRRISTYTLAAEELRKQKRRVTRCAIAKIAGYERSTVCRDFRKVLDLHSLLALE